MASSPALRSVSNCGVSNLDRGVSGAPLSSLREARVGKFRLAARTLDAAALSLSAGGSKNARRERPCFTVHCSANGSAGPHTDTFVNIFKEEEILAGIKKEAELKKLPKTAVYGLELFYRNYRNAIESSGVDNAEFLAVRNMSAIFDRIMKQFVEPFTFPSHHIKITEPYNYYEFGQNFARPLIDFNNSYLGNVHIFDEIEQQLKRGENVILLSNHQTEADPAVIALLLEKSHPTLATDLTYVAGDRVVLDPMCKPFSMGRNLLCVFSKKRMNDVPELAAEKMAQNRRTLRKMSELLNTGGMLIWIAPSGGRDRPDPITDEWVPAQFDASSVEMMRRLSEDATPKGHLYPMSLLCYDIMPPPRSLEKELGEQRVLNFHGVALSVAHELDFNSVTQGIEDRKQAREVYSSHVFNVVKENYDSLKAAVHEGQGFKAGSEALILSQPWKQAEPQIAESEENVAAVNA